MIVFSVGPPGRFAAWCDDAIARLVETGSGPALLIGAETQDEVATALIRSAAPHLVVASRRPAPLLRQLLAGSGGPVIVALDDPRRGLHELVAEEGQDIRAATRTMAVSSAAAQVCAGLPGAAVIHGDMARRDPAGAIGMMAQACGLKAGADARLTDNAAPIEAWWNALDASERTLADGALAAYADSFRGGALGEITWDRTLFWLAADPGRNAGAAIELGADPGPLIAGPEIGLPPGNWAASVTLAVSREAAGVELDIEIRGPDRLAGARIVPDARGLCAATLLFTIAPASGQTISLAIANTIPAPGGRLALGNVILVPSPAEDVGIPSELTAVLGLS